MFAIIKKSEQVDSLNCSCFETVEFFNEVGAEPFFLMNSKTETVYDFAEKTLKQELETLTRIYFNVYDNIK